MSKHVRQQLREAVVTKLKTISVFGNRVYPFRTRKVITLPDVVVFIPEETVIPDETTWGVTPAANVETREATLAIAVRQKENDTLDDTLDGYCLLIEAAMMVDESFGGILKNLRLENTEITLSGEGEKPIGMVVLTYKAMYRAARNAPGTTV